MRWCIPRAASASPSATRSRRGGRAIATACLIADIGGTNVRLALTGADGRPTAEQKLAVADYPGPVEAARAYLGGREVSRAVFAVATPVTSDQVALTNSPWVFSISATRAALGLERLEVINDFTAQAVAIPALRVDEREQIGGGTPEPGHAIGVIGPGTGLGVGGLLPVGDRWQPIPVRAAMSRSPPRTRSRTRSWPISSSASATSPPSASFRAPAWSIWPRRSRRSRVSRSRSPIRCEVPERARRGGCRFCSAALARFSAMLGAAAGDLALTLGARGGIYIGGGLAKRLGELFDRERFRASFVAKGRLAHFLEPIPTYLITRRDPGLLGAAALAMAL